MTGKILALSLCFIAITCNAISQELSVELNGGAQGLHYTIDNGNAKLQPGGSLGIGYSFPVQKHWDVITGINGGYYATKATLYNGAPFSSFQVDDMGSAFQYNVKTTGFQEKQQFWAAGIPVLLQYHTAGEKGQWYINGGAKFLLPFGGKAKGSAKEIAISGYYPDVNVEVSDLPAHGFGTIENWSGEHNLDLKPSAMLSLATGYSFKLSESLRLYTGIYADYGVNTIYKKDGNGTMLPYSSNGINHISAGTVLNMTGTGDAKPLALGVQFKLSFVRRKTKSAAPLTHVTDAPVVHPQPEPKVHADTIVATKTEQPKQVVLPAPIAQASISAAEVETVQQPITFTEIGNIHVPESLKPRTDSIALIMKKYGSLRVSIIGHTCNIGSESTNLKIGLKRAQEVAAYLKNKGVEANRIDIRSAGEKEPLVPDTSEKNRVQNRRVVIVVL